MNVRQLPHQWFYPFSVAAPLQSLNITLNKPEDNNITNQIEQNFSFSVSIKNLNLSNCTLWENFTGVFQANQTNQSVITNNTVFSFNPMNLTTDGIFAWNVGCLTPNGSSFFAANNFTLTIDTTLPVISINPNNAFTSSNQSRVIQYENNTFFNITVSDERDLFAFEINVTKNGILFFNHTNSSLSGNTNSTFSETVSALGWAAGLYDIKLIASDSHTKTLINDYEVQQVFNKIKFRTTENNLIEVSSFGALSTDFKKNIDRYSFSFNYLLTSNTRTFTLESESQIYYLPDSEYNAHFVIWNGITKKGNWIDFEGIGKVYEVVKINDNTYYITFMNLPIKRSITINSIGGLNVVTENYNWYRGTTIHSFSSSATTESVQVFSLNVTKLSGFVEEINTTFFYNNTKRTLTKTEGDEFTFFTTNFVVPDVEQSFSLEWIVNITQNDSNQYNFSINAQQNVLLASLNITFLDEQNQSLIRENVTAVLTLEQTRQGTSDTGHILFGNLTLGNYFIQGESATYNRRGIFLDLIDQSTNLTIYLLKDITGTSDIDYFIKTTSQRNIENVKMTFQRPINSTFITVAEVETDFAGQVRVFQDQTVEYRIILTHPDFPTKVITLRPLLTSYTIFIDEPVESLYNNVWEGIIYSLKPRQRVFNISTVPLEVSIDLFADDGSLEYFGVFIDGHSFTCVPASCVSNITGSPFGGLATVNITGSSEGSFDVHYFFKRNGFNVQFFHGDLYWFQLFIAIFGDNIANWLEQLVDGLGGRADSKVMLSIFAAILTAVLVVIASQLGVIGLPLVLVAVIGNIFFVLARMIPIFTGIVTIIVGIFAYIVLARD